MKRRKQSWTLNVQCGDGSHEITITLNGKGEVKIFSPCDLLPETTRKIAGSCCLESLARWLIKQLQNGDSIPAGIAFEALMTIEPVPFIKSLKDHRTRTDALILCSSMVKDGERYEAAKRLAMERKVKVLIQILKEGGVKARYLAAEALGKVGGKKAKKALEKALVKEKNEWVRRRIVVALGKIGDKRSIPSLIKALKREESEEAIRLIVEAMDHIYRQRTNCFVIVFPFSRS